MRLLLSNKNLKYYNDKNIVGDEYFYILCPNHLTKKFIKDDYLQ